MNASMSRVWVKRTLISLLVFGWVCSGCHSNGKITQTDGDVDGELTESQTEAASLEVSKWFSGNGSVLAKDADGRLVSVSKAGLVILDTQGTPADFSDDTKTVHTELTDENWPSGTVLDACVDGSGAIWFAEKAGLFRLPVAEDENEPAIQQAETEEIFTAGRDVLQLMCLHAGGGVWVSTTFGFLEVVPGEAGDDPSAWTITDHRDEGSVLSQRPHFASLDSADRLWATVYDVDTYKLFVDVDGTVSEIAFGFADPAPTALVADGDQGVWVMSGEDAWYFSHNGTPADASDDSWTQLPATGGIEAHTLIPIGSGRALVYAGNLRDMHLLDTHDTAAADDDTVVLLPSLGMDDQNRLVSAVALDDAGLWFSSEADFGLAVYGNDLAADGWTSSRLIDLGSAPANDLAGFSASGDQVYLGGPNGVVTAGLAEEGTDAFTFSASTLAIPDKATPFHILSIAAVSGGLVVGGDMLAYMDSNGAFSTWEAKSPSSVSLIVPGPNDVLWLTSTLQSIVTVISFAVYDFNGTPKNGMDDETEKIDTEYFGFNAGVSADTMAFFDGCKALIGNSLGLHYYDCNGTAIDPSDDIAETGLLDGAKLIKQIEHIGEGKFWVTNLQGLHYLDMKQTADPADDTVVDYEHPGQAASFAVDSQGRLITFITGGLLVRDPVDTPADPSDDLGALFPMDWTTTAVVRVDAQDGWWFGKGDGSGIYYGELLDGDLLPIEQVLTETAQ